MGALVNAASTGKLLPANVEKQVTEAASLAASASERRRLVNRAVAVAENELLESARNHADEIVVGRLRPKVHKALECLPDAARLIPAGMDDASAFRAASEVQNAYRKLIGAAELVDRVVEIRRQMCNNAGNAAAIDFPQPNVFRAPEFFGGLRYGMVSNFYDLYKAGTWPAGEMPMRERLLALHRAGAEFHLATGEEITAMVAADVERYRADNLPSSQRPTRRVVGF
ncbi:MAG: hypothetical protein LC799_17375 [Actinobacteria bacterium]|nr:hypothetical protein [Actinomycetota bacterium]